MPRTQRPRFKSSRDSVGQSDQLSASSSQIVPVSTKLSVRPERALSVQAAAQFVLYRPDGTLYRIMQDAGRSRQEVAFEELETGEMVELIRDPHNSRRVLFAVWGNDQVELADHVRAGDNVLIPPRRHDHIVRNLVLPSGVAPYGSLRDLVRKIRRAILMCVRVPNPYPSLLAAYVVYTWLADRSDLAVHLSISGLPESGKTTLLELLRLFCRRSLLTVDTSAAGFSEACSLFSPTVMIDEAELDQRGSSRNVRRLLRAASNRYHSVMRRGFSWDVFGPKIICTENPPDDPALLSRCLVVAMTEHDTSGLKKPSDPEILELSRELQRQLLRFRFEKCRKIRAAQVPGADHLHPRQRDLLTTIAAPFADDPEWLDLLLQSFENTGQSSSPALPPPEAAMLDGLWAVCHTRPRFTFVFNSELIALISGIYAGRGEKIHLESVSFGRILKKFGIDSGQHTRVGNGFWTNDKNRLRVHELVKKYGLTLPPESLVGSSGAGCHLCERSEEDADMLLEDKEKSFRTEGRSRPQLGTKRRREYPETAAAVNDVKDVKVKS